MPKALPDLHKLSDEALATLEAEVAAERTAIRLQQNDIQTERELRLAASRMSGATREAFLQLVGGSVHPTGQADAEGGKS